MLPLHQAHINKQATGSAMTGSLKLRGRHNLTPDALALPVRNLFIGAPGGTRTPNPLITNQPLCQLKLQVQVWSGPGTADPDRKEVNKKGV